MTHLATAQYVGDELIRSGLDDYRWNTDTTTWRRHAEVLATAAPYLPASTVRRATVHVAALVHPHLQQPRESTAASALTGSLGPERT